MGQSTSAAPEPIPTVVGLFREDLLRNARQLAEVAFCSYDEFIRSLREVNSLSSHIINTNGKRLFFAIKKGTDQTFLWRATVRIAIVEIEYETAQIETKRLLTLQQFLNVFETIQGQLVTALRHSSLQKDSSADVEHDKPVWPGASTETFENCSLEQFFNFSILLKEVDALSDSSTKKLNECCICLERQPDVMLPCAHAYCSPCIEQWNSCQKTCPICRESIKTTDEAWVISDIPGSEDICEEISSLLADLTEEESSSFK